MCVTRQFPAKHTDAVTDKVSSWRITTKPSTTQKGMRDTRAELDASSPAHTKTLPSSSGLWKMAFLVSNLQVGPALKVWTGLEEHTTSSEASVSGLQVSSIITQRTHGLFLPAWQKIKKVTFGKFNHKQVLTVGTQATSPCSCLLLPSPNSYPRADAALARASTTFLLCPQHQSCCWTQQTGGQSGTKKHIADACCYILGLYVARQCRVLISVWMSMHPPGSSGRWWGR